MTTPLSAPLPAGSVASLLGSNFAAARTLPVEAYLSEEVLDWERRHVFDSNWVCVGRSDLVPEPGSQRAIRINKNGLLLVRDHDKVVRAFHNTCRHRGHELLAEGECRRNRMIGCPYHAWAYSLTGDLVRASRFTDVENFDASEFPLVSVAARESGGWIFVAIGGADRSFAESIGTLGTYLEDWEPERLVFGAKIDYRVQSNWKLIVENSVECYHCPSIHPELCAVSDPDSDAGASSGDGMWIAGPMKLRQHAETLSLSGAGSRPFRRLQGEQLRQVRYLAHLPNLLITLSPDYLMTHRLEPLSPTETFVECAWFFPPEATQHPGFDPAFATEFWERTNAQDFKACEAVNRAMRSPGFRPGPFDHREVVVHSFQAMMARAYTQGQLSAPAIADLSSPQQRASR